MSLGVFIPARTKSKRLPNKLLLPMGDSNLFEISCKKVANLPDKYGKYALVCEEPFIEIANHYGLKILMREPETIDLDDPIRVTMGAVEQAAETHMMFLNPCLAFLTYSSILDALQTFESHNYNYATSVKEFHNWLLMNHGEPVTEMDYCSLNTKRVNDYCQFAHCFHIFNRENFLKDGLMLKPGFKQIFIKEEETIDVDTEADYQYAKWRWDNIGLRD